MGMMITWIFLSGGMCAQHLTGAKGSVALRHHILSKRHFRRLGDLDRNRRTNRMSGSIISASGSELRIRVVPGVSFAGSNFLA